MAAAHDIITNRNVLLLKPLPIFKIFDDQFFTSSQFNFLKAYESSLPLHQFLTTHAQSVQAILTSVKIPITSDIIQLLPALRLILTTSAGLDHIDLTECRRRRITVAGVGECYSPDVAEAAVMLLIDVLRNISSADRYLRRGLWVPQGDYSLGSKLGGKRVGIVGLGSIGLEVAKRLKAFGCIISYNSRSKKQSVPFTFYSNVVNLAANSDALIICCALTDNTRHMINKEVLLALGKNGVIVNVARGAIIDEVEMVKCLVQGEIGGAGLDVFENEPDVPKELFELDNVVLAPHSAAPTFESCEDMRKLMVGNLEALFSDAPLLTPVSDVWE